MAHENLSIKNRKKVEEVVGRIIDSSGSQLYRDFKKTPKTGYHHIMIQQENGIRIKIYLSDY